MTSTPAHSKLAERSRRGQLPPHAQLPEPQLVFSPGPNPPLHVHPLLGLRQHGPYAGPPHGGDIRVATIGLAGQRQRLFTFLAGLRNEYQPSDRKSYLPPFPGFAQVARVPIRSAADSHIDLDAASGGSQDQLVAALARAITALSASRDSWDVIAFLLPAAWEHLRESPDGKYQLHDRLKAAAAPLGVPVQMLRESSALAYTHYASLAWRLSIAFLVKAGGIPWRIQPTTDEDTAYIGLAYAIRGGSRDEFITCCSQVMDADGGGMEFVAYNIGAARDLDNPHLTRDEMRAVMARSAHLYQQRHAGRLPSRLSVHKSIGWRREEVMGVLDAWPTAEVECIHLQTNTPWRAVGLDQGATARQNVPASWPVRRGTLQQLSTHAGLLWITGTAGGMSVRQGNYNPAVKGIPAPSLIVREAGRGPLEPTARDLLALSKLDWNNDAPFDLLPVTLSYSQRLATVIGHVPALPDNVYQYRLFM